MVAHWVLGAMVTLLAASHSEEAEAGFYPSWYAEWLSAEDIQFFTLRHKWSAVLTLPVWLSLPPSPKLLIQTWIEVAIVNNRACRCCSFGTILVLTKAKASLTCQNLSIYKLTHICVEKIHTKSKINTSCLSLHQRPWSNNHQECLHSNPPRATTKSTAFITH